MAAHIAAEKDFVALGQIVGRTLTGDSRQRPLRKEK